jgi:hypothetical protein
MGETCMQRFWGKNKRKKEIRKTCKNLRVGKGKVKLHPRTGHEGLEGE